MNDAVDPARAAEAYRPRILMAEDDPDMRRLLATVLERGGYKVEGVANGSALYDALRRLKSSGEPPALILSDVRMPGLDGIRLVEYVRGWGWTIPVVLITAFCDDEVLDRAWSAGATLVLSKPFPMSDLASVVKRLVPRRRRVVSAPD
jgi:CheY-like chemotaxis protein